MKILITGVTGLIGIQLIKALTSRNDEVMVLTKNISMTSKLIGGVHNIEFYNVFDQIDSNIKLDCIINLDGEPDQSRKWNPIKIEQLIESRKDTTKKIVNLVGRLRYKPKKLINASAIWWYGYNPSGMKVDEKFNSPTISFHHSLYDQWEKEAFEILSYGTNVKIMRFGIVLTKKEGLIKKITPLFKYNMGFYLGKGNQYMSWIHINDLIKAIFFLIDNDTKYNIYNFTSPYPVTNKEFSKLLASSFDSKLIFRIPNFLTYLFLLNKRKELLLNNLQALPSNLLDEGFIFEYPTLETAIANL